MKSTYNFFGFFKVLFKDTKPADYGMPKVGIPITRHVP